MQFTKAKLSYSDFISKVINPGLIFIQKATLLCLFLEGLVIEGNFVFQNGLGLTIKTA